MYCKKNTFATGYDLECHWENDCQNKCLPLCQCTFCTDSIHNSNEAEKKHTIYLNLKNINDNICFSYYWTIGSCAYQCWDLTWKDFYNVMFVNVNHSFNDHD